ncbi:acyl-CoA dehydrogenase C-terminal domain-containing protein [Pelagovum pacificum]|uniref:3-methylmercaptopropionyl-CoA dehydrogenase n=1 Tax=Pelagovum pacificum TaxID=2588711 RepID=A0A5C5GG75_9RHOB|nr:acyl-CoA dehydrogenase C-terminal domain-containing protein [Pelagovum pacificum]QQA43333.1 acyl-CoA dehydrogenase C-terminal domain-containing protein [Pelagovum pacificum]TNY33530.1 acyl-CoA dehydrogenase [Pelagovum pacificum]
MPTYTPPTKDMDFVLHDLLKISTLNIPGYADLDRDTTQAILEECGKLSSEVLAPLNRVGDEQGCTLENGVVRTPDGFKDGYRQIRDGGWLGLDTQAEYGGQGMPYMSYCMTGEMFVSANMALNMYQGLTHGAITALQSHASEDQKQTYLPKMNSGEWSGTMNLTEPHCGTDLGLIKTKAEPQEDGTYRITGQKIWISAGEHDLTDNIIHLVLAKIPGGPEGTKGISLFIVPKFMVKDDGSLGDRNAVSCGGLESKMGIHGNATCVMNYDGATGFLVGEEHKGMRAMFTMMNEARLGVALQGFAQGAVAYENALGFARERLQGRDVTGVKNPDGPADPIIVHPDVRRNLMDQKAFVEGARALIYWGAILIDRAQRNDDAEAEGLASLLTPVLKGFLTDKGFETTVLAQQTLGGSGFTREWGIEQFVRDARITMIYEGTNGIQALDLVGRKLAANGGKPIMAFFELIKDWCKENAGHEDFSRDIVEPLKTASKQLQQAGMYFMQNGMKAPNNALAGSYDFMHMMGHVCLGYMWAQMAKVSTEALAAGTADPEFHEAKVATAKYFMARQLPAVAMHLARIESGAKPVMALDASNF